MSTSNEVMEIKIAVEQAAHHRLSTHFISAAIMLKILAEIQPHHLVAIVESITSAVCSNDCTRILYSIASRRINSWLIWLLTSDSSRQFTTNFLEVDENSSIAFG